jgi:hypothetical protein
MCQQYLPNPGFVQASAILSRRGNKLAPESVTHPIRFGEPKSMQYAGCGPEGIGSGGWSSQELFPHVKSQGYTHPRMI